MEKRLGERMDGRTDEQADIWQNKMRQYTGANVVVAGTTANT